MRACGCDDRVRLAWAMINGRVRRPCLPCLPAGRARRPLAGPQPRVKTLGYVL
jgi:hypothetical protein